MLTKHPDISEDFLEFLIERLSPEDIISFKVSPETQARADELTKRNKSGEITPSEHAELQRMMDWNSTLSLLKVRAMKILKEQSRDDQS
ncbi:MAG: hypothetical protein CUN52_06530 [Phototrophicales bacterium]|nr:MAG: hypothetical protein CUN52_06530 [Phototrophicales bacterium]